MPFSLFRFPVLHRLLLVLLLMGAAHPRPAYAATAAGPTANDLNSLVQTLQDPGQRQALIGEIKTLIAVRAANHPAPAPQHEGPGGALVALLSGEAMHIGTAVTAVASMAPLTELLIWAKQIATDPELRLLWARGAGMVLAMLGAALLAGRGARAALKKPLRRLHEAARGPVWLRVVGFGGALLLGWVPALVLLAIGYAALAVAQAAGGIPAPARELVLAVLNACALLQTISAVAEALLIPAGVGSHFLPLGEETADYWLVWSRRLTRLVVYGWFALTFAFDAGMNSAVYDVLLKAFGLVLTGLLIMLILQNRVAVARVIHGPKGHEAAGFGRLRAILGDSWHIAAILYLLGTYGVWASDVPGGFTFLVRATLLSLLTLAVARGADAAGTRLLTRFLTIAPELEQRLPGLQKRVNLYSPLMIGTGRLLVYVLAVLLALQAWGIDLLAELETREGQRLIGGLVTISFTVAIAIAIWEAVSMSTELYLLRPGADGTPVERSARTRTLLPLFRKTLAILLGVAVILMSLATLGVNIGPLLAGAGIAGIAIGFGAQSLVKDVITGMFVLMQDAVSVGDVVSVAGNSGLVEQISIRSIRLRDQSGTVIIIPFSEVTTVQNMTKDFSYAVFSIGIAYREDVDEVITVVTAIAGELQADTEYTWRILEPIEILGLDQFADSAVIVKARIKTKPIQQWNVMREFNRRMKRRFDDLNIEIPFPHQTIYFGADREGKAPPAHLLMEKESII
jgi:small conductance mechanosensitive channel